MSDANVLTQLEAMLKRHEVMMDSIRENGSEMPQEIIIEQKKILSRINKIASKIQRRNQPRPGSAP